MSQDHTADRTASNDAQAPDFYLPGTPSPTAVDRVWGMITWLLRPRGRVRVEQPREFEKR
ncbi:hypothetical protein [Natronobeatus ordinarius]|uniref:hypothetical protein n=1 Tax=Natronobeatus ordinarius TaxID=2963433 RepID=UPI0020CE641E|nr:hypothetical protein [Natronobeatus ordinarius]